MISRVSDSIHMNAFQSEDGSTGTNTETVKFVEYENIGLMFQLHIHRYVIFEFLIDLYPYIGL